jgi:micrococcal nuclease
MGSRETDVHRKNCCRLRSLYQPVLDAFAKYGFILFLILPTPVWAGEGAGSDPLFPGRLKAGLSGVVEDIPGPALLRLAGVERLVRLAGIWADSPAASSQPEDHAAVRSLAAMVQGRTVQLYLDSQSQNRFGQWLAQVTLAGARGEPDGWVQGEMLRQGYARVYTTVGTDALAAELLAAENQARQAARGLWRVQEYAVRSVFALDRAIDSFQIVEGVVAGVGITGSRVYLNFGEDWRRDFTIVIARSDTARFPGKLRGLKSLEGKRVRVRGWVFGLNGPAIRADHAGVLEVIWE